MIENWYTRLTFYKLIRVLSQNDTQKRNLHVACIMHKHDTCWNTGMV